MELTEVILKVQEQNFPLNEGIKDEINDIINSYYPNDNYTPTALTESFYCIHEKKHYREDHVREGQEPLHSDTFALVAEMAESLEWSFEYEPNSLQIHFPISKVDFKISLISPNNGKIQSLLYEVNTEIKN